MPPADPLGERLEQMRVRLEKEIARYQSAPGTVRVGGLAKTSKELELVLRAAFDSLCASQRLSPESEILRTTDARSLAKATLGPLARAIQHLPPGGRSPLPVLRRDLSARRGAVWTFIELRNRAMHPAGDEPSPETVIPVLRSLLTMVRACLRERGVIA